MELVESKKEGIFAESHLVARKFGMSHAKLVLIIQRVLADYPDIKADLKSALIQEKYHTEEREYRGARFTCYMMNREFFTLVAMRLRTKLAIKWQRQFNNAFYEMERRLLVADTNATDPLWLKQRDQGKLARKQETDVIKDFVAYATDQGSTKAEYYYKHITNATYAALGLMVQSKPKLRDTMDMYEISELLLAERLARSSIQKYMDLGRNYKDIYTSVKDDLIAFGSGLKIE